MIKRSGIEPIAIIMMATNIGKKRFFSFLTIQPYTHIWKNSEKIYDINGVSAMGSGVGFSGVDFTPRTMII